MKVGLSSMTNMLVQLAKSVLVPFELTAAAAAAADTEINKKILGSKITALFLSTKEMKDVKDIMEIAKSLEDSGILIKDVTQNDWK